MDHLNFAVNLGIESRLPKVKSATIYERCPLAHENVKTFLGLTHPPLKTQASQCPIYSFENKLQLTANGKLTITPKNTDGEIYGEIFPILSALDDNFRWEDI